MITSNDSELEYARLHCAGKEKLETFRLRDLGFQYKIEKTEDWEDSEGYERSYSEIIRVKDSEPVNHKGRNPLTDKLNKIYYMPSHLYKYSERELGLYLKDHKQIWSQLARITGEQFNEFDRDEEDFVFPIEKFSEVAKFVQFRQKRKPPNAFIEARDRINSIRKSTCKGKIDRSNFQERESDSAIDPDHFEGRNSL
jgi:hypothetical protein